MIKGRGPVFSWEGVMFVCQDCGGEQQPEKEDVRDRMRMPQPPRLSLDGTYRMRATCEWCGVQNAKFLGKRE